MRLRGNGCRVRAAARTMRTMARGDSPAPSAVKMTTCSSSVKQADAASASAQASVVSVFMLGWTRDTGVSSGFCFGLGVGWLVVLSGQDHDRDGGVAQDLGGGGAEEDLCHGAGCA